MLTRDSIRASKLALNGLSIKTQLLSVSSAELRTTKLSEAIIFSQDGKYEV